LAAVVVEVALVLLLVYPKALFPIFSSIIIAPAFSSMFPTSISAILFPYRRREIYLSSPGRREFLGIPIVSLTGIASAGFILFLVYEFLVWPGFGLTDPFFILMNFGLIPIGCILYVIASLLRKRDGIDLTSIYQEIPPE